MYKRYPSLILGFHACDQAVAERVLSGDDCLHRSTNDYDWLGNGIYFWENSPRRAAEWGDLMKSRGRVKDPTVVGAVISPGRCFDLLEADSLQVLRAHYQALKQVFDNSKLGEKMPVNKPLGNSKDLLLRRLDCAVIEYMHAQLEMQAKESQAIQPFDSVRGAFWEGEDLYPSAGFKSKNHIQVCVRNINCIKGYFRPLDADLDFPLV